MAGKSGKVVTRTSVGLSGGPKPINRHRKFIHGMNEHGIARLTEPEFELDDEGYYAINIIRRVPRRPAVIQRPWYPKLENSISVREEDSTTARSEPTPGAVGVSENRVVTTVIPEIKPVTKSPVISRSQPSRNPIKSEDTHKGHDTEPKISQSLNSSRSATRHEEFGLWPNSELNVSNSSNSGSKTTRSFTFSGYQPELIIKKSNPVSNNEVIISIEEDGNIIETSKVITIFGRYDDLGGTGSKKCATVDIGPDTTVKELFAKFTNVIGKRVIKILAGTDSVIGDNTKVVVYEGITHGGFVNIYFSS